MSDIQKQLRLKGRVELGDQILLYGGEWMLLKEGDTYIGQSGNEAPEILTMRRREIKKRTVGGAEGKIFPKERKKPLFNLHEVVKVTIMENPNPKPPKEKEKKEDEPRDAGTAGADERSEVRPAGGDRAPEVPRADRPKPVDPRRGGKVDYAAAAKRAREAAGASVGGSGEGDAGGDHSS